MSDENELPPAPPENVHSAMPCISCDARKVVTDMGPHEIMYEIEGKVWARDKIEYPVFQCAECGEAWTDWRGEKARTAWRMKTSVGLWDD